LTMKAIDISELLGRRQRVMLLTERSGRVRKYRPWEGQDHGKTIPSREILPYEEYEEHRDLNYLGGLVSVKSRTD
jgi:hypothetical protein